MPRYRFTVEVETDTIEHAHVVLTERIFYDEEYPDVPGGPFDYSVNVTDWPTAPVTDAAGSRPGL